MMSLQEFEEKGGCQGCYFYVEIEKGQQACTFRWHDDDSDDWNMGRNCDEISE